MFHGKSVAVVVPAYNVEHLLHKVIDTMPAFVDWIVVVDDCSRDGTSQVAKKYTDLGDTRVVLLRHEVNRGVGAAIGTGYKWGRDHAIDVTAVMGGDYQMDPLDLDRIVEPIALGLADYSKGNRLFFADSWEKIPKIRFLGNSALSLMTKIASGYWHSADSQSGYTGISLEALQTIDLDNIYPRYGCPNDILVKLNIYDFRVIDVPVRPVYGVGEKSGIKIPKVIFSIGWLLVRLFFWRLREKYVIRDFHPLVFFYLAAFFLIPAGLAIGLALLFFNTPLGIVYGPLHVGWIILCALFLISGSQALCFAMWFDLDYNRANCIFFRRASLGIGPRHPQPTPAPLGTAPPAPIPAPEAAVRMTPGDVAAVLASWIGVAESAVRERVAPEELARLAPRLLPVRPAGAAALLRRAAGTALPHVPHLVKRAVTGTAKRLRQGLGSGSREAIETLPFVALVRRLVPELGGTAPGPGRVEISHDVDWPSCYAFCERLAAIEREAGVRSAFLFLARDGYTVDPGFVRALASDGFKIGVHGWTHDVAIGLRDKARIRDEIARARDALGVDATIYRAPGLGASEVLFEVIEELGFQVDGSQRVLGRKPGAHATGTIWPFLVPGRSRLREHPLGMQDDQLFRDERLDDAAALLSATLLLDEVVAAGGSFVFNAHPTLVKEHPVFYEGLLAHARAKAPVVPFGEPVSELATQ